MRYHRDVDLNSWYLKLEARHLRDRSFSEVRRSLQALSIAYVQRGGRERRATQGAGKRAAFALFYGTLHLVITRHVVAELGANRRRPRRIVDLGCGTGVVSAAWSLAFASPPPVTGVDLSPWAIDETRWVWRELGLKGSPKRGNVVGASLQDGDAVVLGWTVNEIDDDARKTLLENLLSGSRGPILILEPISRRLVPWWREWQARFEERGGRSDEWKFRTELPERLRLLDRAAGLDHQQLTARTLYLPAQRPRTSSP